MSGRREIKYDAVVALADQHGQGFGTCRCNMHVHVIVPQKLANAHLLGRVVFHN